MNQSNQIPDKINLFNVYRAGNKLLGLSEEVALPEFAAMTETISGPGILGEVDSPVMGHFSAMEMEVPFRILNEDIFSVMAMGAEVDLTLRASQQALASPGGIIYTGMRVVVRGTLLAFNPGSVKQGAAMGASLKIGLTYIYIERDGKPKVELDKLNGVYKVNGVDQLAAARKLC